MSDTRTAVEAARGYRRSMIRKALAALDTAEAKKGKDDER